MVHICRFLSNKYTHKYSRGHDLTVETHFSLGTARLQAQRNSGNEEQQRRASEFSRRPVIGENTQNQMQNRENRENRWSLEPAAL